MTDPLTAADIAELCAASPRTVIAADGDQGARLYDLVAALTPPAFLLIGRPVVINLLFDEIMAHGDDTPGLWLPELNERALRAGRRGTYRGASLRRLVRGELEPPALGPGELLVVATRSSHIIELEMSY